MITLLLANRDSPELFPLTAKCCVAMLPIAGKPLIVHAIESLAIARLTEAVIVTAPTHLERVRQELGSGARWGMRFDYVAASGESPDEIGRQLSGQQFEDTLVVRADILRTPMIAQFLAGAASVERSAATATIRSIFAGVTFVGRRAIQPSNISKMTARPRQSRDCSLVLDFPDDRLSLIDSLASFHRANIDVISDGFPGLVVSGRTLSPGVIVGPKARLKTKALRGRHIFIGSRCHIAGSAELMDNVIVSDNVVIDRGVTLNSAIVMPNTYIGEMLEVSDAIVQGNTLIHVDTGSITTVSDPLLLSSIQPGMARRLELANGIDVTPGFNSSAPDWLRSCRAALRGLFAQTVRSPTRSIHAASGRSTTLTSTSVIARCLRRAALLLVTGTRTTKEHHIDTNPIGFNENCIEITRNDLGTIHLSVSELRPVSNETSTNKESVGFGSSSVSSQMREDPILSDEERQIG